MIDLEAVVFEPLTSGDESFEAVAMADDFTVRALTPAMWDAFAALVDKHNGVWGGCWCIYFHPDGPERGQGPGGQLCAQAHGTSRRAKRTPRWSSTTTVAIGMVRVRHAGGAAEHLRPGAQYDRRWICSPTTRTHLLLHRPRPPPSGRLGGSALRGALDLIAQAGGGVVEGYPRDLSDGRRVGNSFLYNSTRALYERAGFSYVRPKGKNHTVMRRTVDAG